MVADGKSPVFGDAGLAFFNFLVEEFFHLAALQAYQMIMMSTTVQFEHRFSAFKMMAFQQSGLFKLGEYPIHCCQANVFTFIQQGFVHILCRQVSDLTAFKQTEYPESWQCGFESHRFEIIWFAHNGVSVQVDFQVKYLLYHIVPGLLWKQVPL